MEQGGFGGQYETGMSSRGSPDERSDIRGRPRISLRSSGLPADYAVALT
jgi:hypothetical protein